MFSLGATAVTTKSRARYGKRLTHRNFDELLSLSSVAEVGNYLKTRTHYGDGLEGLKEAAIHRGNLETLLKAKMFEDLASLCKFEYSVGEQLSKYMILKGEINELISFLRYLNSGNPNNYLFALPDFFKKHTDIDLIGLSQVKTFKDFLDKIKNTPFKKLLTPFFIDDKEKINFAEIEATLDRYLFDETKNFIVKSYSGEAKAQLLSIFTIKAELENIKKIYRAKMYYNVTEEYIASLINNEKYFLKKAELLTMIAAKTPEEVLNILKKSMYGRKIASADFASLDKASMNILYNHFHKMMRLSTQPSVVMACTIFLFEFEMEDIINIIEGIRYNLGNEKIRQLLVSNS